METVSFNLTGAFKGLSRSSSSASSYLGGDLGRLCPGRAASVCLPLRPPLTIESAHMKGARSTKNGRDSTGKRLSVKIYGDQVAQHCSIIARQRGTKVGVYPIAPENPNSYRARKREYFRLQRERKKARKEGVVPPQLVLASIEESFEVNPVG